MWIGKKKVLPKEYRMETYTVFVNGGVSEVTKKVPMVWSDLDVKCNFYDRWLQEPVGFINEPRPMVWEDLDA